MNAASRSASSASCTSSTFSAFISPERDRLNEPAKTVSSATVTFACMKSCGVSGVVLGGRLALEVRVREHRREDRDLPGRVAVRPPLVDHLLHLRAVDHAAQVHAPLGRHLGERAEHRARGDHRRRDPHALARAARSPCAIRCESSSPCPGVNQARTCAAVDVQRTRVLVPAARRRRASSTAPRSSARTRRRARARSVAVSTTFSWSVHESVVQFIEPVHTELAVAHHVLVVHQVGDAGDAAGGERHRLEQLRLRARRRREEEPLGVVGVVGDPHPHAALGGVAQSARHDVARLARQADVVERQVERLARLAQEGGHPPRHLERVPAGMERKRLDHCCQRKPAGAMRGSSGLVGSPSGSCGLL